MDANGNWHGYVKSISQNTALTTTNTALQSPAFTDHVVRATKLARSQNKLAA
jgi:hypothetical protein